MSNVVGSVAVFDLIDAVQLDTSAVRKSHDRIIKSKKDALIIIQNEYLDLMAGLIKRLHDSLIENNKLKSKNNALLKQCSIHQQEIANLSIENQTLKTVRLGTQNYEKYKEQMAIVNSTIQKKEDQVMKIEMRIVKEEKVLKTESKAVQIRIRENHKCLLEKKQHLRSDIYTEQIKQNAMKKYEYIYSGLSEAQQKTAIELGWFNTSVPLTYRQEILALVARLHNDRDVGRFLFEKGKIATPRNGSGSLSKSMPIGNPIVWLPQSRIILASLAADKHAKDMSDIDLTAVPDSAIENMKSRPMQDCDCSYTTIATLPLDEIKKQES